MSRLSSGRTHLEDERSALFYEAVRIFELVEDVANELNIWVLKFLENVVADKADVEEISSALQIRPVLIESGDISRVRRPRLYWLSTPVAEEAGQRVSRGDMYDRIHLEAEVEPLVAFLKPGTEWPAGAAEEGLKFPTFTRAIPRKRPPPSPAGIGSADEPAKERWVEGAYRYPPYTYAEAYMVNENQLLRPLNASEREVLMGFPKGFTLALAKKAPTSEQEVQELEDARCSALGNSFHTNTVAALLDMAFCKMGLKKLIGAKQIVKRFLEGLVRPPEPAQTGGLVSDSEGEERLDRDDTCSVAGEALMSNMELASERFKTDEELLQADRRLSAKLVSAFIRRQEYRGSDVRLDLGSLYRPESFPRGSIDTGRWLWHAAQAYAFERAEHINVLELRALIQTFEWRLRSSNFSRRRALHLTDSMVALSVCVKGRSSARVLNRLLKRFAALQIAGGIYPVLGWVESEDNPADEPSRRYA